MSRIKNLESKTDFSVSYNFKLACESILTQLQTLIPSEQWFIVYKDLGQWILLYSDSSLDSLPMDSFTARFDSILAQTPGDNIAASNDELIGLPLVTKDKRFSGAICAYQARLPAQHIVEQSTLLNLFTELICYQLENEMLISQQKYKNQQLLNLSHTDSLTQLLNHRAWSQMLMVEETRAKRYTSSLAIFIVDLDNLKVINDTEGHNAGDLLIIDTANCLRDVCRESDMVARLGGDEFGLLAVQCDEIGAQSLLNNIHSALEASSIEASVGYCVMTDALNILETAHIADKNMYKAKSNKMSYSSDLSSLPSTEVCQ